jgi:hypothetical protein
VFSILFIGDAIEFRKNYSVTFQKIVIRIFSATRTSDQYVGGERWGYKLPRCLESRTKLVLRAQQVYGASQAVSNPTG